MDRIFNEKNYRKYLENHYNCLADKFDYQKRKKIIDKYSEDDLQKIVDDSKTFALYAVQELEKTEFSLIDTVYMKNRVLNNYAIDTKLIDHELADELYSLEGFDEDFYVSKYLLESFFKTDIKVYTDVEEYFNEELEENDKVAVNYLGIVMPKEKFADYKEYLTKPKMKVKK